MMKISHRTIDNIMIVMFAVGLLFLSSAVFADRWHHEEHDTYDTYNTYNEYVTTEQVTDIVNTTNIENYSPDQCQGVALAMATGSHQLYGGTQRPQFSVGAGECSGEVAGSLMFGVKPWKKGPLINGSFALDEDVSAFGIGASWVVR